MNNEVKQIYLKNALYSSNPSINQALIDATKHGLSSQKTIYEITGQTVKDFISTIELIAPQSGHIKTCACLGNPKVLFFSKGKLLTSFTIHHGKRIRWSQENKGDIDIELNSQKKLNVFFIKYHLSRENTE